MCYAFSVVRGGNFWQGAAAGAFSSLAGSAFQAWCPIDIRTSFVGVTAFSAVVGGAGAYLGGARSPAEILMGVAAGAMVGALNHGLHLIQVKKSIDNAIIKAGFIPGDVANWTDEELTTNIAKIFPEMYQSANSPKFETKDIDSWGKTPYDIITQNGKTTTKFSGTIYMKNAQYSVRSAAAVAGHELCHAIDLVNGTTNFFLNFGIGVAKAFTEVHAYSWEINMGSVMMGPMAQQTYNGFLNTTNHFKMSISQ